MRMPRKILVQTLNGDQSTTYKKMALDPNNKVLISPGGGSGNPKIEPTITPDMIFTKGKFRTPYLIYPYGAKTFLKKGAEELPEFSINAVDEYFQSSVLRWIRTTLTQKDNLMIYVLIMIGILNAYLNARGFGFINV
jgi:hypothetical protein